MWRHVSILACEVTDVRIIGVHTDCDDYVKALSVLLKDIECYFLALPSPEMINLTKGAYQ